MLCPLSLCATALKSAELRQCFKADRVRSPMHAVRSRPAIRRTVLLRYALSAKRTYTYATVRCLRRSYTADSPQAAHGGTEAGRAPGSLLWRAALSALLHPRGFPGKKSKKPCPIPGNTPEHPRPAPRRHNPGHVRRAAFRNEAARRSA